MDKFANVRSAEEAAEAFRRESPENERLYSEAEARNEIADRMTDMRKAAGISQSELARRVGRAQSFIARLEKGAYARCGLPTIRTFARALGYDVSFSAMFKPIAEASYSERSSCDDLARICRIEEVAGDMLVEISKAWNRDTVTLESDSEQLITHAESKEAQTAA